VRFTRSGTAAEGITFKSENKWGAVLDCQMVCDAYFDLYNASYITIQDFDIARGYKEPSTATTRLTTSPCAQSHPSHREPLHFDGPRAWTAFTPTRPATISTSRGTCSTTSDAPTPGAQLDHALYLKGYNYTIINNIFYSMPSGWAIQAANGLSNTLIANNTFAFGQPPDRPDHAVGRAVEPDDPEQYLLSTAQFRDHALQLDAERLRHRHEHGLTAPPRLSRAHPVAP